LATYADSIAIAAVVIGITYLSLIIGELVPKRFALANAERIAIAVARPMAFLARAAGPVVWFLGFSTNLVMKILGLSSIKENTVTEEEVKTMIAEGTESGVFAPAERELIEGVLRLADRTVRGIMTPRPDVVWLDVEDPPETAIREIRDGGHSRLPVCRGDLDEVLGVVHTKALLDAALAGRTLDLRAAATKPLIVHDGTPVLRLLELFRQSGVHMAIVVDEYGSVEGLATVTDILEAIAGELPELGREDDPGVIRRDDGTYLVDGMLPIDEVEARLGLRNMREEDEDFHTLAGFILRRLGRVPKPADAFHWEEVRFEVVDMDGRRVDKVLITPAPPPEEVGRSG
jgi:putative hemolysin